MAEQQKYFIVQTIWHEGQRRHAMPGELVELDHLSPEQITSLQAANVILPETEGKGRFSRNLSTERPPLPPDVVQAAFEQAASDPANAQAEPAEAKPARRRASKKKE